MLLTFLTLKVLKAILAINFRHFTWKQAILSRFRGEGTSWWAKVCPKVKVTRSSSLGGGDLREKTKEVELVQLVIVSV